MVTLPTKPGAHRGAERLVASLLPLAWNNRPATIAAAEQLDHALGLDAAAMLLRAFVAWRRTGSLPGSSPLRDIVASLGEALGEPVELRLRPRPDEVLP